MAVSCIVVVGSVIVVGISLMGVDVVFDSSTMVGLAICFLLTSFSPLAARLGLRNRPPSIPDEAGFCLVSPSIAPVSPVTSVVLSFFPPRLPNKDVRRFSSTASGVVGLPVPFVPRIGVSRFSLVVIIGAGAPLPGAVGVPVARVGSSALFSAFSSALISFFSYEP